MNVLRPLFILPMMVALSACGPGDTPGGYQGKNNVGIVNSTKVDPSQDVLARGVAHLDFFYGEEQERTCTGTLIGDQVLLTAAHCVEGAENRVLKPVELSILNAGANALNDFVAKNRPVLALRLAAAPDVEMLAVEVAIHPNFLEIGNTLDSDIALIRLAKPVRSAQPLPRIKIDSQNLGRRIGAKVWAYGYGFTVADVAGDGKVYKSQDGDLHRKELSIVKTVYSEAYLDMSDSFMIDTVKGKSDGGTCEGDSGGPVLSQTSSGPTVLGTVSRGAGDCRGRTIIKSVSYYQDWIRQTAAAWKLQLY